jgi:2',3'-cyclic-nucleotide 2'-phosphodiesterase
MRIMHIGDISGRIGRQTVAKTVPSLRKKHNLDLVTANAENIAHGSGLTESTVKEILSAGVDLITTGDHAFRRPKHLGIFDQYPMIRPLNFSPHAVGKGYFVLDTKKGKVLVVNLIGRVFIKTDHECPFAIVNKLLERYILAKNGISAIIIDMHAEATSEKIAMRHFLDGRVSAVLGTHTHVTTADEEVTEKGTAYVSDIGMTGYSRGCLGLDAENVLKSFTTQINYPHEIPETGPAVLSAALVETNDKTGQAKSIKMITKHLKIK